MIWTIAVDVVYISLFEFRCFCINLCVNTHSSKVFFSCDEDQPICWPENLICRITYVYIVEVLTHSIEPLAYMAS